MAITLASPIGAGYLAASSRNRAALGRFSPHVPDLTASPIWIHACSVGELGVAQPLLNALAERYPNIPRLLTTSTVTGRARAETLDDTSGVSWFPFDHPLSVARFLRQAKPRLLILIETELWPNVLRQTTHQGIPIALVNGRLSDRHFRKYSRSRRLVPNMISQLTFAGVQDETYAERFVTLGMSPDRIQVTGNLKFDSVPEPADQTALDSLRAECGISSNTPVIVFGSTRPGDERHAIACWRTLRSEWPDLQLIVAPRHIDRVPEIVKLFAEPVHLRTELRESVHRNESLPIIVDTHGELLGFYSIATVAVIGGSFDSAIQGHNPIESAAMGVPTVFGPYMRNFEAAAEALTSAGAALQLAGPEQLHTEISALLCGTDLQTRMGHRGQEVVASNRGALQRTMEMLDCDALITGTENHSG